MIKKAYRRLSLILHPDKNKDENAETQFRQVGTTTNNNNLKHNSSTNDTRET